jgi:hypothetical protein
MGKKYARFAVNMGELGGEGARRKRRVVFEFWDGGVKVGTLTVTTTKLWWSRAWERRSHEVSVANLDEMFGKYLGYR